MGIFSNKRKKDEAFKIQLEREALDQMNSDYDDDFILPFNRDDSSYRKIKAPNVLTAEELMGKPAEKNNSNSLPLEEKPVENIPMSSKEAPQNSAEFLYKKMTDARNQALNTNIVSQENIKTSKNTQPASEVENKLPITNVKAKTEEKPFDLNAAIMELRKNLESPPQKINVEKIPFENEIKDSVPVKETAKIASSESTANEISVTESPDEKITPEPISTASAKKDKNVTAAERRTSLLARCNAYLEDDEFGTVKRDTEKYRLESVENILQNFEARATQKVLKNLSKANGDATINLKVVSPDTKSDISKKTVSTPPSPEINISKQPALNTNKTDLKNEVKHHFSTNAKAEKSNSQNSNTKDGIVLDAEKIGLKPSVSSETINSTQIFTTISSQMNTVSEKEVSEEKTVETNSGINLPEQEIFDYKSLADKTEVLDSILSKKRKFTLKSAISAILLIISLLLLSPLSTKLSLDANVVFVINTVLLLIGICFNFDILKSIPYLFNSKTDVDLPFAAALLITFVQNIFCFASAKNAVPFTSVALLSLLFNNLAKKGRCSLLIKNFNLIANDDNKKAVCVVNNRAATKAMVGNAIEGEALVCCGVETKNINDFLKYSYCNDPTSKRIKNLTIVTCTFGFIFGLIAAIFNPSNIIYGINIFSAISLIAAAPTTLFAAYLPFKSAASRLSCYNAMLSGYKAANELDRCNALVVDCSELFPKGNIKLVDMKLLSPNPIDQSILDAEALAKAIGSPLYGLFSQVKNTSGTPTQPKVDSMVYEDKMGISGWVDDRRVFVGNRVLLESHGFTRLPPIELDKKIMRKGYFPIYLVSDNVPCAMFVVKYIPDEEIAYELHRLCNTGTTVLINNCDPNISANMICDYFNLYKDTVSIMSKQGSEQYSIVSGFKENKSAGAAYDGSICGLMATLTAAINSKRLVSVMSVMNTIFSILGILGITVLTIMGSFSVISAVPLIVFQAITSLITLTIPEIYKP